MREYSEAKPIIGSPELEWSARIESVPSNLDVKRQPRRRYRQVYRATEREGYSGLGALVLTNTPTVPLSSAEH